MGTFRYLSGSVHYLEEGDGDLLVLLPGNTAGAAAYAPQLPVFGESYHAVALDFLGTGRSDRRAQWPEDWWGDAAEQVAALIRHLGRERAIVVGTSGGAVVALRVAAEFPDRVRAVVADSFSAGFDEAMLHANVLEQRRDPTEEQREFWRFCHGDDWRSVVDADTAVMERLVARGGDWLDVDLKRITVPVLLTGSTADPAIPDIETDYRRLAARIPDATVLLVEEGRHPFMWTRPERFQKEALTFLNRRVDHD